MTTGRDVLLEVLRTEGVEWIFGNPGSTELPLIDALAAVDDIGYALALQEATAVGMADGYAQATGRPAFLNLHTSAGLGNAVGNLTNAGANRTPLVVSAGQQDYRHIAAEPLLSGDLVGLARPVSKWAHELRTVDELGTILRRAFLDAAHPPGGPVFVSLPMDLLDQETLAPIPARSQVERRTIGARLDELARLVTEPAPGRLAIVLGDEVAASGGMAAAVALAERLGAPVHGSPLHSNTVFPTAHPLWAGPLPPAAAGIRASLGAYERVLLVGGHAFLVYPFTDGSPVPEGCELLHLAPALADVGRSHPVAFGTAGDLRASLEALVALTLDTSDEAAAAAALGEARERRAEEAARFAETAEGRYDQVPVHPMAAVHAVLAALPHDPVVVDEAITTGTYVRGFHHTELPGRYFFCRGGGLGWGMPAALGVSLGYGREKVLCFVGDGSAMYSPQALWTAAHLQLPITFVVVNNQQYLILKRNLAAMKGASVDRDRFVAMDLDSPPVDFPALASSMGVPAVRVEKAHDVGDAVAAAWEADGPRLVEIPISS